jgi:transmembrane sensor
MIRKNYSTPEDFASDESFQDYFSKKSILNNLSWEFYKICYPGKQNLMDEAFDLLQFFTIEKSNNGLIERKDRSNILRIAASFLIILGGLALYIQFNPLNVVEKYSQQIASGQNKTLILSDQSLVELREGSKVEYNDFSNGERKVRLNGEAYFHVKKDKNNKSFSVALLNGIVKVLGTKFLVKTTSSYTKIILEEGSIQYLKNGKTYDLNVGEILYSSADRVEILKENISMHNTWMNSNISFKNMAIKDVVSSINNSYDIKVELENKNLEDKKITATVNQNDPILILKAIAAIYDIKMINKANNIILR